MRIYLDTQKELTSFYDSNPYRVNLCIMEFLIYINLVLHIDSINWYVKSRDSPIEIPL